MKGNFGHFEYTPYGEIWIEGQKQEDLDKTPYRFTSKEWDEETELYYMSARYQDPMTSRWISADPIGPELLNPMDNEGNLRKDFSVIETVNWYSYCSNLPTRYYDPTGYVNWDTVFSGTMQTIAGVGKITLGVSIIGSSGGAEVASGGAATPLAVAGAMFGSGLVMDGFVTASTGLAEALAGLVDDDGSTSDLDIPGSLPEMIGIAGDEFVEAATGEETDVMENVGEFIGSQPVNTLDLLLTPTDLGDGSIPDSEIPEFPALDLTE